MQLLLPPEIVEKLVSALTRAGAREIGGILMGEHAVENVFRVKDLTVQYHGGSLATFWRAVQNMIMPLRNFFRATGHKFTCFNSLGEWHSHPAFLPEPSPTDHKTMRGMVEDPELGAHFVALMVVKLNGSGQLQGSVTVYQAGHQECRGELIQEEAKR
jgi:proteasome lid subunit RPN8/RPN11